MDSTLILTLAVFVLSTSVTCNSTTAFPTETVTTFTTNDQTETATATADAVTTQLSQAVTETDISATTIIDTTIISTTMNDLTTIQTTTNNDITTILSTTSGELTTIQSDVPTTIFIEDERATTIKNIDSSMNNSFISDEKSNEENFSTDRVDLQDVTVINNVTDIFDTTVSYDDDNDHFNSTPNSIIKGGKTKDLHSVVENNTLCRSQKIVLERRRVESWDNLKINNNTVRVNTVAFNKSLEPTEWFVLYDTIFREAFAEIIKTKLKKMMNLHEESWTTNVNCTVFTPEDVIYVSPSPFKHEETTVVSFIACDSSGDFCLELKNIEAVEKKDLENKLNLTIWAVEHGTSLMDSYQECQKFKNNDSYDRLKFILLILLAIFGIVMFSIMIIVTKSRKKSRSYNTGGVAYLSNRFLKHCPGSGQNLASDQQCQLEEITDTPPTFRNKHLKRPAPSVPRPVNDHSTLENEPPKSNANMEAKL